jgi:hypothetical protein
MRLLDNIPVKHKIFLRRPSFDLIMTIHEWCENQWGPMWSLNNNQGLWRRTSAFEGVIWWFNDSKLAILFSLKWL